MRIIWFCIFVLSWVVTGAVCRGNDKSSRGFDEELIVVPAGTFLQKYGEESFNHTISSFKLGKYEVTYNLWYSVYQWAVKNNYVFANQGCEGNDGVAGVAPTVAKYEPVTGVNWRDTIVWCNAYSEKMGYIPVYYTDPQFTKVLKISDMKQEIDLTPGSYDNPYIKWDANGYRLPTDGEWKYTASYQDGKTWAPYNYVSGDPTGYCYPLNEDGTSKVYGDYAWFRGNAGGKTHEVNSKRPNQLGFYNMCGNVWEWCWDWHNKYPADTKDYRGPKVSMNKSRHVDGGSWYLKEPELRIGKRINFEPYFKTYDRGFRVARSIKLH